MVILSMKHSSATTLNPSLHRPVDAVDLPILLCDPRRLAKSYTSCCDRFYATSFLCDKLDNTTSFLDLLLGLGADVAGADDDGDSGETALSEDLSVAVVEEVEDGSVLALVGEVLVTLLGGDERPELVQVDNGLPEQVLLLVEVTHTNLSEVTGMVLVDVGTVVVLTTNVKLA